jgi:hypothetical protein
MFLEARYKLGIFITNDKLQHHVVPNPHNNLTKSKIIVIVLVGAIFANLENRSTTTRMASIHSGSWVMKSMDTLSHGSFKIVKGLYNSYFFLYIDFVL